jgi:hypothetical protein
MPAIVLSTPDATNRDYATATAKRDTRPFGRREWATQGWRSAPRQDAAVSETGYRLQDRILPAHRRSKNGPYANCGSAYRKPYYFPPGSGLHHQVVLDELLDDIADVATGTVIKSAIEGVLLPSRAALDVQLL